MRPNLSFKLASRLASFCLFIISLAVAMPAHAVFKCVDEKGVTHYGDTMPPQCEKKEVKEISTSGSLIRKYDAPLTPEQLKVREDERIKQAETQRRIDGQRQKDLALLGTFGSEREFDSSRDRDLSQLDGRTKTLKLRIGEVDAQLEKVNAEIQFYTGDNAKGGKASSGKNGKAAKPTEVPPRLTQALDRANSDREGLTEEMAKVDADKLAVSARYDAEKTRWKLLKSGMQPGTLASASPAPATTPAPTAPEKRPASH